MSPDTSRSKVRILLVDDDEEDYLIIRRLFTMMKSIETELEWVASSDEAIGAINERRHDAYLIDYRLDARTGLDVLQEVNAAERKEPFILLTGVIDDAIAVESLQHAASDYLEKKNLTSDGLSRAVYYALGRKEQELTKIEQLKEINRTKDEFISIASHQLRTPATAVKQYIAMVIDGLGGELTEKQSMLLAKAYDNNERQLYIINSLLKVAQVDAGKMQLQYEQTDISSLLHDISVDFAPQFRQNDQHLECVIESDVQASVDKSALRMLVDNLLENAMKYSPRGASVNLELTKIGENTIEIIVRDEGVGVAYPDRLFQKFSRITNALSTEVGGTGLGLYWAKSIARMHGGDLVYLPNKPKGSQFVLLVPVKHQSSN